MINLYDVLGLNPKATPEQILDALQQHTLDPKIQKAVHAWLLDPAVRPRYDARLKAQDPAFFGALQELYHPNYASLLGLVFLPSACYLHAFNWQKLGNPKKAKQNHTIAVAFLVFMTLVILIAVRLGIQIPITMGLMWVFVWYYGLGKEQIALINDEMGNQYIPKRWQTPVLLTVIAMSVYGIVLVCLLALLEFLGVL